MVKYHGSLSLEFYLNIITTQTKRWIVNESTEKRFPVLNTKKGFRCNAVLSKRELYNNSTTVFATKRKDGGGGQKKIS